MSDETIKFEKREIKKYLDKCIILWREKRDNAEDEEHRIMAVYYIDAFQSVRTTIFGETLPVDWSK